ncbi:hypothetical protein HYS28_01020 [Candidatus Uhrbacteria bacterium]|nr:hypothetical protein [Candidatus Uhrbacteria bacterium]
MKRRSSSLSQHPLSWAFLVLAMAFASLAIAILVDQNDTLTNRVAQLEAQLAEVETAE